jgi:hypothetical protein
MAERVTSVFGGHIPCDGLQNGIGGFGPEERLWVIIMGLDKTYENAAGPNATGCLVFLVRYLPPFCCNGDGSAPIDRGSTGAERSSASLFGIGVEVGSHTMTRVARAFCPFFRRKDEKLKHITITAALLFVSLPAAAADPSAFELTLFDIPGSAGFTAANGINEKGTIVGNYFTSDTKFHGFVGQIGHFETVDWPNAPYTNLTGINARGELLGIFNFNGAPGNLYHSFTDSNGHMMKLPDVAGSPYTIANGINDRGDIVGYSSAGGFLLHRNGRFTPINIPGALDTIPTGINGSGDIVGYYAAPNPIPGENPIEHAFLYASGHFKTIDFPGAPSSPVNRAFGINNFGEIVDFFVKEIRGHAFFRDQRAKFTSFDGPDTPLTTIAGGINDAGEIVGSVNNDTGTHLSGFLTRIPRKLLAGK